MHAVKSATIQLTIATMTLIRASIFMCVSPASDGGFFFWKAASLITLCREGPYWPEGRYRAREKFKGR